MNINPEEKGKCIIRLGRFSFANLTQITTISTRFDVYPTATKPHEAHVHFSSEHWKEFYYDNKDDTIKDAELLRDMLSQCMNKNI